MSTENALKIVTPDDLQGAERVLVQNQSWVKQYEVKFNKLLDQANKEGVKLTPETDAAINNYLASSRTAVTKMEDQRKPYTQKLDQVVKLFTSEENKLKKDFFAPLQDKRNASVAAYAKEEAEQRKADQLKLDKEKERIAQFASAEEYYRNAYAKILRDDKELLLKAFEGADLGTIEWVQAIFVDVKGNLEPAIWDEVSCDLRSLLLGPEECKKIAEEAKAGKFEKIAPHYKTEIRAYADYLLTLIPTRIQELKDGKDSEAAEKLKIEQVELEKKQAADSAARAQQDVSNKVATAVIDIQVNQASRSFQAPKTQKIESYEINILARDGWAEIFKFYLTHSDEQDLGKIKLDSMKIFAERYAKNPGIKIESSSIQYVEKFKAVVKSTRKAA